MESRYTPEQLRQALNNQRRNLDPSQVQIFDDNFASSYTIIVRPPDELAHGIKEISNQIEVNFPDHYYYPQDRYHVTLFGGIPSDHMPADELVQAVSQTISHHDLGFSMSGIGANKAGVSIPAFFKDGHVFRLRQELRSALNFNPDYSLHDPVWEHLGWSVFMRYKHTPEAVLFDFIEQFSETEIGTLNTPVVGIYRIKSRTLEPGMIEEIALFT